MSKTLNDVIADMTAREEKGLKEYGCTVDREDLSEVEWLQHLYEETLDTAIYLKRLINLKTGK